MKNKLKTWKEYLDQNGKLVEKPVVSTVADYKGKNPASPDPSAADPNGLVKYTQHTVPYSAPGKDSGLPKQKGGLADEGDKNLVYKPGETKNKQKELPTWPKTTTTEQFINETKNMSMSEFIKHMKQECTIAGISVGSEESIPTVTAYTSGGFHPYPPEAINYVVYLANKNERILENLIQEIKRQGCLGKIIKSIMNINESYDELVSLMDDEEEGPKRCNGLIRAMDDSYNGYIKTNSELFEESVGAPIGFDDDEDDDDLDIDDRDEISDLDDMEDTEDEDNIEDIDDMEDIDDLDDMDELGDIDDMEDENDMEDIDDLDDMEDMEEEKPKKRKPKKRFHEDNLLDALNGNERIKEKMKAYMNKL